MPELKKRYYLSKFVNPIVVSDEFAGDDELIELMNKYKELQFDFKEYYQMVEERRSMTPVYIT